MTEPVKIGYLGADGHGKSTLISAMLQHSLSDGATITVSYEEYAEFTRMLQEDPVISALVKQCIQNGGRVDLGCDPGMTREGKDLLRVLGDLK